MDEARPALQCTGTKMQPTQRSEVLYIGHMNVPNGPLIRVRQGSYCGTGGTTIQYEILSVGRIELLKLTGNRSLCEASPPGHHVVKISTRFLMR